MELLLELPEQIFRDILLLIPYKFQSKVKNFLEPAKEIMECSEFYQDRVKSGTVRKCICFVQEAGLVVYDPVDQFSEMLTPLPSGFKLTSCSRIIGVSHKIVLLGLQYYDIYTPKILILDIICCTWKGGAEIPSEIFSYEFACCAGPEGSIYIAGGYSNFNTDERHREAAMYKVEEDKWELLPDMNEEIAISAACFIEGKFYVIAVSQSLSQIYDPKTRVWTSVENMSLHKTWNSHLVCSCGELFAFGNNGMKQYVKGIGMWVVRGVLRPLYYDRATAWYDQIFICGYTDAVLPSISAPNAFYMFRSLAPFREDEWIPLDKPKQLEDTQVIAVITIEI